MIYLATLYLLQFLTVGAMFVTIMIFFDQFFKLLFVETGDSQFLTDVYNNGILKKVLFSAYLGMIFLSTFVSIALPIDRAMGYFRIVAIIMAVLMLASIAGITYFLAQRGFFPPVSTCLNVNPKQPNSCEFQDDPNETYFSMLCLAGVIMLSMYILPMLMRPLDFLSNFKNYTLGFCSYMLMMPVFTNVFQIYAMCNLHDVSWGNRPTSTGQEAFSANKQQQVNSENDYKVYRTNFVLIWLLGNVAYYIAIIEVVDSSNGAEIGEVRDSDAGYLAYFSLYLAGLVAFRVIFAIIYILKWKCRYNCLGSYKVAQVNLLDEFKKIKKTSAGGESTDDEEINKELDKLYEENKDRIGSMADESMMRSSMHEKSRRQLHDETIGYIAKKDAKEHESDEDYDFKEFEDAEVEEAEDRIYSEYKKRQAVGEAIDPDELADIAGNVPI